MLLALWAALNCVLLAAWTSQAYNLEKVLGARCRYPCGRGAAQKTTNINLTPAVARLHCTWEP